MPIVALILDLTAALVAAGAIWSGSWLAVAACGALLWTADWIERA